MRSQTGARLVGFDFAPSVVEHARARAEVAGVSDRAAELDADAEESRAMIEQMREGLATMTRCVFVVAVKRV